MCASTLLKYIVQYCMKPTHVVLLVLTSLCLRLLPLRPYPPIVQLYTPQKRPPLSQPLKTRIIVPTPTALPHLMYPYTIAGLRERTSPAVKFKSCKLCFKHKFTLIINILSMGSNSPSPAFCKFRQGELPGDRRESRICQTQRIHSGDGADRAAAYLVERGNRRRMRFPAPGAIRFQPVIFPHRAGGRCVIEFNGVTAVLSTSRYCAHRYVGTQHGRWHHNSHA